MEIYSDILSDILSGIYPDILSEEEKKEEKKEKEATPTKSRDPHLVGGDKKLTVMLVVSLKDELPVRSKAEQIRGPLLFNRFILQIQSLPGVL